MKKNARGMFTNIEQIPNDISAEEQTIQIGPRPYHLGFNDSTIEMRKVNNLVNWPTAHLISLYLDNIPKDAGGHKTISQILSI